MSYLYNLNNIHYDYFMVKPVIFLAIILLVTLLTVGVFSRVTKLKSSAFESTGAIKILGVLSKLDTCLNSNLCYRLDLTAGNQIYYVKLPKNLASKVCSDIHTERDCASENSLIKDETASSIRKKLDAYLGKPVEIRGGISNSGDVNTLTILEIKEKLVTGLYAQGEQKILVILYHWKNMPSPLPFTPNEVDNIVFSGKESFSNFMNEVSRGRTKLTGKVTRWYEIETEYNPESCSYNLDKLYTDLESDQINKEDYNRIVFVRPYNPACSGGGSATTGGKTTEITLDGVVKTGILAHEFGHNLSLGHANFLDCAQITHGNFDLNSCEKRYYGDLFSPMGSGLADGGISYHGLNLMSLGYLEPEEIKEVKKSGNYKIYKLNRKKESQIQLLRIYKKDSNRHYYLDYRTAVGLDSKIFTEGVGGATIRISDYNQNNIFDGLNYVPALYSQSYLVSSDNQVRAMKDGEVFTDNVNNLRIKQLSHNDRYVELQIRLEETKD